MNRQRVLVISHTYAAPVNRLKLDVMAKDQRFDLLLVTPRRWRNQITMADNLSGDNGRSCRTLFVDVWFAGSPPLYLIPRLRTIIRQFQPHLVYCEQEPICLVALQTAMLVGKTPLVYLSWENVCRQDFRYRLFSLVRLLCLAKSLFMVAGSMEVASVIRRLGYTKPIYVTPHLGVSEDLFTPACTPPPKDTERRPFVIGFIGRFVRQKGVETLLEAVSRLALPGGWRLVLVGGGPERDKYERLSQRLGIRQNLYIVPPVPHDAVPAHLRSLDVLVLPSRTTPTCKEQFGHVLIEAMACGVPVVGSSSGAIPDVIGDAGLVFREGDAHDLCLQLTKVYEDPAGRETLRQRGFQRVRERYTDSRIAANMIGLFEIALGMERLTANTLRIDAESVPKIV